MTGVETPSTFDRDTIDDMADRLSVRTVINAVSAVSACTTSCLDFFAVSLKKLEMTRHVVVEPYLRNSRSVYMYLLDQLIHKMPPSIDLNSKEIKDQINTQKSLASRYVGGGGGWKRTKKTLVHLMGLGRKGKKDAEIVSADTASTRDLSPFYVFALLEGHSFNRELRQTVMVLEQFRDWGVSSEKLKDVLECLEAMHHGLIPFNFATHQRKRLYHIPLTIELFINGWASHYWDIHRWLTDGYPTSGLDIGSLQNPRGVLHALQEAYAFKHKKSIEEVYLHARLVAAPSLKPEEGSITLTGLHLHNATWNERHRCIQVPSYVTDESRHPYVKIAASLVPQQTNTKEQYLCPLYFHSSAYMCIAQPLSSSGESRQDNKEEEFLIAVPVYVKRQSVNYIEREQDEHEQRASMTSMTSEGEDEEHEEYEEEDYDDGLDVTPALFAERNCALYAGWRS